MAKPRKVAMDALRSFVPITSKQAQQWVSVTSSIVTFPTPIILCLISNTAKTQNTTKESRRITSTYSKKKQDKDI